MLAALKREYSHAWIGSCCENDCGLGMDGIRGYETFKGELLDDKSKRMCDCVIFTESKIVLVEIKGRNPKPHIIREQFANGAAKALEMAKVHGRNPSLFFVLLVKGRLNGTAEMLMQSCRPRLRGKMYTPVRGGCYSQLEVLLARRTMRDRRPRR